MAKIVNENPNGTLYKCEHCGVTMRYYSRDIRAMRSDDGKYPEITWRYVECPVCHQSCYVSRSDDVSLGKVILCVVGAIIFFVIIGCIL